MKIHLRNFSNNQLSNNMGKTTITDIPREGKGKDDKFGLIAYEQGLETFLRGASTPITVALQGEWGSGKTSLMNVLENDLCGDDNNPGEFLSVWINTWEYSLMRDPHETLLQILFKMATDVVALTTDKKEEIVNKIMKGVIRIGTAVARSAANKVADGAFDDVIKAFREEAKTSIADSRKMLQDQINECVNKHEGKKGIIFFIDDLDRIDPPVAVELLELLKNLFTLEKCLFILAIDYDVVIKGLKPKFGELNDKNEREFRSFFDKIIQVPFSMPVSQYSTKDYLIKKLNDIGVLDSTDKNDVILTNKLNKAELLTVGHNPRSIKRFLNTLSLIKCINEARQKFDNVPSAQDNEDPSERKLNILLNLSIVGIQVAYPKVYQLLCIEPGFTKWDDKIASKMGIPSVDEQTKERLKLFKEFDEPWEQVLYRLCLTDKYLHNNAVNISQLLNMLREEIQNIASKNVNNETESEQPSEAETIKDYMEYQMSQAAITNYVAGDTQSISYDLGELMRNVQRNLFDYIKTKIQNVGFSEARVKYNGGINTKGNYPNLKIWQKITPDNKIRFEFRISSSSRMITFNSGKQFLPEPAPSNHIWNEINSLNIIDLPIFNEFKKEIETIASNDCYRLYADRHADPKRGIWFNLGFDVTFDNPDAFLEERSIKTMQDVTYILFDIIFKLYKM